MLHFKGFREHPMKPAAAAVQILGIFGTGRMTSPCWRPTSRPRSVTLRPQGQSPFLLVSDHAGRRIPRKLGDLGVSESELRRHIAWDVGIEPVVRFMADELDAHAILQPYSRLVIDCNRPFQAESSIAQDEREHAGAGQCEA